MTQQQFDTTDQCENVCVCVRISVQTTDNRCHARPYSFVPVVTSSYLAISDVLAVYLEELLCESLLLLGGGRHHSGRAQGWEHGSLDAVLSGRAIGVLEVGTSRVAKGANGKPLLGQSVETSTAEQESQWCG